MRENSVIDLNGILEKSDDNYISDINDSSLFAKSLEINPFCSYSVQENSFPDKCNLRNLMFPPQNSDDYDVYINSTDPNSNPILTNIEDLEQKDKSYKNSIPLDENEDNKEKQDSVDGYTNNQFFSFKEIQKEIIPLLNSEIFGNKIIKDKELIKKIQQNKKLNEIKNDIKYSCGRKKLGDKTERSRTKYSYDNVILNIKGKIFNSINSFVNKVIDLYLDEDQKKNLRKAIRTKTRRENENEDLLKILSYSITKKIEKDHNLNLLQMNLKEFLSQEISSRFYSLSPDSNKIIIDLLCNEKNNEIINSILQLKVEEYLDFYTYKKEIDIIKKIENEKKVYFNRANVLLNEIAIENDNLYFSIYIFHLFNFKWWFEVKTGKQTSKKKIK